MMRVALTASEEAAPVRNRGRSRSPRICSAVFAIFPGVLLEIGHVGLCAELAKQFRRATGTRQARDFAIRIVQVAEDHGFRRAGLNAGRIELAILQIALFACGLNFRAANALHAESALFHDAHAAYGDVWIQLKVQRLLPLRIIKIEETHCVWTGVSAKARPDAAIVDLRVQAFGGVITRVGGADRLAGVVVPFLADHGLEADPPVCEFAFPLTPPPTPL